MAANEYEAMLDGKPSVANEYDQMLADGRQEQKQQLQGAMFVAAQTEPDRRAKAVELGRKLNLPSDLVERNYDTLAKKHAESGNDYDAMLDQTPGLAKWAGAHPDNAAVSRDDLPALGEIERHVQDHSKLNDLYRSLNSGLASTFASIAKLPAFAWDTMAYNTNRFAPTDQQIQSPEWLRNNPVAKFFDERAEMWKPEAMERSVSEELGKGNWERAGMALATQAFSNLPQMGAVMLAGPAGAIGTGALAGAQKNAEAQASGTPPVSATSASMMNGAFEMLFERMGTVGLVKRLSESMAKTVGKSGAREVVAAFGKTVVGAFLQEGSEEGLTQAGQDFADYITGVNPDGLKNIDKRIADSFLVGGAMGVGMGGPGAAIERAEIRQTAQTARDFYKNLGQAAQNTKLYRRLKPAQRALVSQITEGTSVQDIYIEPEDFDAYFQSKNISPSAVAKEAEITQAYEESKETGAPIKIPTAQWVDKFVGTEHYDALENHIKFAPNHLSIEEAIKQGDQDAAAVEKEAQAAEAGEAKPATREDELDQVEKELAQRLTSTGRYSANDAKTLASVQAAQINVMSETLGRSPLKIMKEQAPEVRSFDALPAGANADALNQSQAVAPTFYSKLIQTVEQKMGGAAAPEQINGMLREIKPEERKWMGLDEFLQGKEKVSKAELLEHLRGNQVEIKEVVKGSGSVETLPSYQAVFDHLMSDGDLDADTARKIVSDLATGKAGGATLGGPASAALRQEYQDTFGGVEAQTKFSQYTLPGGESYREVLFTLPEPQSTRTTAEDSRLRYLEKTYGGDEDHLGGDLREELTQLRSKGPLAESYRSSHYDEPNVLAHTRLNDRVDADGKRVLFVEEIQSDWHQAGRKKGYKTADEESPRWTIARDPESKKWQIIDPQGQVETRYSADDQTGAEAYVNHKNSNLGTSIESVPDAPFKKTWHEFVLKRLIRMAAEQGYDKVAWTTGEQQAERYDLAKQVDSVTAEKHEDGTFTVNAHKSGSLLGSTRGAEADIEAQFGKDLTKKIFAEEGKKLKTGRREYSGVDLKVGGEGMKGFYDKILVDAANKLGKKFGAKVEAGHVETPNGTAPAHEIDITPALRESAITEGFSLFQGEIDPLGFFSPSKNLIGLLPKMNQSTFLHEMSHGWLFNMQKVDAELRAKTEAELTDKQRAFLADVDTIHEWLGVKSWSEIERKHHERWAEAAEQYFGEGKAPSEKLRKAFNRFKVWLTQVYRGLVDRGVGLTPEVRKVMDRLLATEDEIQIAEHQIEAVPLFGDPKYMGMSETQVKRYLKAQEAATESARAQLEEKVMADYRRERESWYQEEREKVRAQVEAEVNAQNVYKAISILQKGTLPDGSALPDGQGPIKLSKAELKRQFGADIVGKLPRGISTKDGVHPDLVAQALGFEDGDALVQAMANAPDRKSAIEAQTDSRMSGLYPDVILDGRLEEEALKAVHNEERSKLLRLELEHLASNNLPVLKEVIRRVARPVPNDQVIRAQAARIMGGKPIRELRPNLYMRAEIKAGREAADLLAKGDVNGAFDAKKRQLLNHELYRAAVGAQETMERSVALFKKIARPDEQVAKTRDTDLVNAARALLTQVGFGRTDKSATDYLAPIKAYDPDTYATISALVESAGQIQGEIRDLSYNDFSDFSNTVEALWDLARTSRQIEIDGKAVSKEVAREALEARIDVLTGGREFRPGATETVTKREERQLDLLGMRASLRRVESWVDSVDGGKAGAFRKYIWQPVSEAIDQYRARRRVEIKNLRDMVKAHEAIFTQDKIQAPELGGFTFKGKVELLGALLHTGNDSNREKLLKGRGWGDVDADGELDTSRWDAFIARMWREGTLTRADYEFLQKTWDYMASFKAEAQRAHKSMYGYYFNEVTANEVVTPFGTFAGGYAPAVADPLMSTDAGIRADQAALEGAQNSFMFPTAGRGFTKSRVEQYAAPLSIDFNLVQGHVDKVLRFIHIEPRVKEVGRLVLDKGFRAKIDGLDPAVTSDMLTPWLQRSVQQRVATTSQGKVGKLSDRFFRAVRNNAGLQLMSLNFINAVQNTTGLSVAALKVKPGHLRDALWSYTTSPKETLAAVTEKSAFMANRMDVQANEMLQESKEILVNPTKYDTVRAFMLKHGRIFQAMTQNTSDLVVWQGAYAQAVESGHDEKAAIREADSAVRLTQGSFNAEDVSRFETGTPMQRAFTQFYGYFNTVANLNATEHVKNARERGLKSGFGRALYIHTFGFMVPAFIGAMIAKGLAGAKWDEDDDGDYLDDLMAMFFGSQLQFATAMIPVAGQAANVAVNMFNDKQYDDKVSLSPAVSMIEAAAKLPFEAYDAIVEDGPKKKLAKDTLTVLGLFSGLPLAPIGKPLGYLLDVNEEKVEPSGPIDFARGLVTGKAGN